MTNNARLCTADSSNGLRVVIAPDQTIPVVTIATFYQTGFIDDPQGLEEMAHLVEHMMARQSPAPPDSDPNKLVDEAGGYGTCGTDARVVSCSTTVPVNQLELVLLLEADRMRGLRMTADRLEIQKRAVEAELSNATRDGTRFPPPRMQRCSPGRDR